MTEILANCHKYQYRSYVQYCRTLDLIADNRPIMASFRSYRTINFSLMFMAYGTMFLCRKSFSYLLPAIITEEDFTKSELGAISSSLMLAYCISKFICGILSDRLRPHLFLTFGLISVGLLNIQFANTHSVTLFALIWFLNGLGQGAGWPPCTKILKQWYHPSELGTWWSILSASSNLAGSLGPLVMSVATNYLGWRYVMTIVGTLCMASSSLVFLFITNAPGDVGLAPIGGDQTGEMTTQGGDERAVLQNGVKHQENGADPDALKNGVGSAPAVTKGTVPDGVEPAPGGTVPNGIVAAGTTLNGTKNGVLKSDEQVDDLVNQEPTLVDVVKSPFLWVICVIFCLVMLQSGAFQEWAQLLLIQDKGFSSVIGSGFTSAYNIGGFIGCIASGFITDKLVASTERRRIGSGRIDYMLVVSVCNFLCQLYFLKLITCDTAKILVVSCAFGIGFCIYSCISMLGVLIVENSPVHLSGTAHAIGALAGNVGAVSSGLPLSYVSSLYDWSMTFNVVLVLTAAHFALLFVCNRMELVIGRTPRPKRD